MTKGFADIAKPFFISLNCWTQPFTRKSIIVALLITITLRIDKTHDRMFIIPIQCAIIYIRIDIITIRIYISGIRIDKIADRFFIFLDRKDKIYNRFAKSTIRSLTNSPRSKSGTYARHTKANTQNPTLHNSQPCPTLLGHTLTTSNSFRWTACKRAYR